MNTTANPANALYQSPVPDLRTEAVTETGKNDSFDLITGEAVVALLLNDSGFQQSWDLLFNACPWATVFQSRPFVTAWYQTYREEHCPVLITATEKGQLTGVLSMAILNTNANAGHITKKEGRLTGAGHYDGLYQTWLAAPTDGDAFIKKAMTALMKQFPQHNITLRFIPPGTPMAWTKNDRQWRQNSIVQSHARPLIKLKENDEEKIFQRKKHFKHKFNRLKRAGEVQFETITDLQHFESSLHEMAVMYDFRQSALFNKSPFREDTVKKEFLLELFRLQLLHVTVLRVDGKMVAAIVANRDRDWMYLASINCHSPVNARWFSPGILHFILLSQQLAGEGFNYFDLTPGYDPYKEELANQHDEVHELIISGQPGFRIKRSIKKWIHARLVASGKRPMSVELNLKKYQYLAKHRSPASVINGLFKRFHKKGKTQRYLLPAKPIPPATNIDLNKDDITDLQQYKAPKRAALTRWEFLGDALYWLERGQHCYTWVENDCLLGCAWVSYQDVQSAKKDDRPEAEHTIELQGIYYHPNAKDRLPAFINEVINTAVNQEKKKYFVTSEPLFCKALEATGNRQ